jgi:hypothetical protein
MVRQAADPGAGKLKPHRRSAVPEPSPGPNAKPKT